jgi:hypothetical protein
MTSDDSRTDAIRQRVRAVKWRSMIRAPYPGWATLAVEDVRREAGEEGVEYLRFLGAEDGVIPGVESQALRPEWARGPRTDPDLEVLYVPRAALQ